MYDMTASFAAWVFVVKELIELVRSSLSNFVWEIPPLVCVAGPATKLKAEFPVP
jgi:hypothetical protein